MYTVYQPGSSGRRYPASVVRASSKTQCQKCLEFGHWTFECKNSRVYKARPTRTQQLTKPLKPVIVDLPDELKTKKGIADKILKEKERERSKKKRKKMDSSSSSSSSDSESESSSNTSSSNSSDIESSSSSLGSSTSSNSDASSNSQSSRSSSPDRKRRRR